MSAALTKAEIRDCLAAREYGPILARAATRPATVRSVTSLLFDSDPLLRWRAVEALGLIAGQTAPHSLEKVRRQVRSLLWLMNDESGGLCWVAAEAIGEIVFRVPKLLDEYGILMPQFFDEEPFERGSRWAVVRMAPLKPELFDEALERLHTSLSDPDSVIRGYSILALEALGDEPGVEKVAPLTQDTGVVPVYDFATGLLTEITVGEIARRYSGKSSSA